MTEKKVFFNVFCIDKRFDALTAEYFINMGYIQNYYQGTTAGAALPLGYKQYCSQICNCDCHCQHDHDDHNENNEHDTLPSCNPYNLDMRLLKDSLIKNIEIALTLDPLYEIYLINHQDCGAIKAFLSCSGYPQTLGENNSLEIEINTNLLLFAKDCINKVFPNINVRLGLMDVNGSVADFDHKYFSWNLVYRGYGNNPLGLWYDYKC